MLVTEYDIHQIHGVHRVREFEVRRVTATSCTGRILVLNETTLPF